MAQYIPNQNEDDDHLINVILGNSPNTDYAHQLQDYCSINHYQTQQLAQYHYYLNSTQQHSPIDLLAQPIQFSPSLPHSQSKLAQNQQFLQQSLQLYKTYPTSIKQATLAVKKQKNSNTIKKIGRIILDSLKQYRAYSKPNNSVFNMLKNLSKSSKVGRTEINKRDKFNTYHLRLLFNGKDDELVSHNLRTTRRILSKYLRDNVLSSKQISDQNKILYMNTMKCSALRCINRKLAVRLQMSTRE